VIDILTIGIFALVGGTVVWRAWRADR